MYCENKNFDGPSDSTLLMGSEATLMANRSFAMVWRSSEIMFWSDLFNTQVRRNSLALLMRHP